MHDSVMDREELTGTIILTVGVGLILLAKDYGVELPDSLAKMIATQPKPAARPRARKGA